MSDKKILTIIDQKIAEEMRSSLPSDVIVDNVITSDSKFIIAPLEIAKEHKIPFYVSNRPNNYKEVFFANGSGYIPNSLFESHFGKRMAAIFIGEKGLSNLSDVFELPVDSFKISQYFQVGSYIDRLVENSSQKIFNYLSIHRSLYHLFQFVSYFAVKEHFTPLECEMAQNDDGMIFQIQLPILKKDIGILRAILGKDENESKQFLTRDFILALEDSDFTDITFVQKTNRLIITSYFNSKNLLRLGGFRFSDEISLKSRETNVTPTSYPKTPGEETTLASSQFPDYQPVTQVGISVSDQSLPSNRKDLGFDEERAKVSFAQARKFALFIKNFRIREGSDKEDQNLTNEEVIDYLKHYPRQEVIQDLSQEIKDLICILVKNQKVYQEVTEALSDINSQGFLEKVEEIQRIVSGKNIEEVVEIITVQGGKEFNEEISKIKGWLEKDKDELIKIKANYEDLNDDEKWEVKKSQLNEALKDEVIKIKSSGRDVAEDDYVRVVAGSLGVTEEEARYVVKGFVAEASGDMVVKRIDELRNTVESNEVGTYQKTVLVQNTKLEEQFKKMKRVMDGMKAEIVKLRAENAKKSDPLPTGDLSLQLFHVELEKTKQNLANKEKVFKKFREDIDGVIKEKDKTIESLKDKIEKNKSDSSLSVETELKRKVDVLSLENRTYKSKLDLALKKLQIMNDNMDKHDAEFMQKKEKEIEHLKNQVNLSQSILNKFKDEKSKLDLEIHVLREKVLKQEEEALGKLDPHAPTSTQDNIKKEALIQALANDKKGLEDHIRIQNIEFKKLEQKMKLLSVQNDDLARKKGGSAKNVEAAHRQVEVANQKTQEAIQEVAEKKKEVLKLKNENSLLVVKIQELERKMATLERAKAS